MDNANFPMNNTKDFSIIIVNYKTVEITKICLDLLHQHLDSSIPIWVVDNYSNDESTTYLRELDWIYLIERSRPEAELGHIAHGKALDLALKHVDTDYVFLLHTDTFVFDIKVFSMMLEQCMKDPKLVAVGCVEQLDRGLSRTLWRFGSRLFKHYFRRMKRSLGISCREPKPYREIYLKSFCSLWNCKLIKQHDMRFLLDDRVPGYTLQDRMSELGYTVERLSPRKLFRYLDHMQSGTVAAAGGYGPTHRRTKMYNDILERLKRDS